MSKLTEKQIALAKQLLKQHTSEKQVYVKVENGHMYFRKESALISVGDDESKLEVVTLKEEKKSADAGSQEKALAEMKFTELKAYAEEKGIALETGDTSKEKVLAKIQAAETPAV